MRFCRPSCDFTKFDFLIVVSGDSLFSSDIGISGDLSTTGRGK